MEREFTEVYCGSGKGKTTLAIGQCLRASAQGKKRYYHSVSERKRAQGIRFSGGTGESGYQDFPF